MYCLKIPKLTDEYNYLAVFSHEMQLLIFGEIDSNSIAASFTY